MPDSIKIPLEVLGFGAVISFAIAVIIQVMLNAIRFFSKKSSDEEK